MVNLNDYENQKECDYKGEHYSVRDNGAVMRFPLTGKKARPLDNIWTFGKPNDKTGYMEICGERVHRIVAYAFLGNPPTNEHVVDHIDTNRRNNRPDNLRWLTRLENALNNPITRARIENICGSIEAFLNNPSILRGHEKIDYNFSWMRNVSKEEARLSLERLTKWARNPTKPTGQGLGEWVFQDKKEKEYTTPPNDYSYLQQSHLETETSKPIETKSLSHNVIQLDWKNPAEFPCCPKTTTNNPLKDYYNNLKKGEIFSRNDLGESSILDYGMQDKDTLWVMCKVELGWKTHAFTKITFKDGIFYHENMGVYDIGDDPEEIFDSLVNRNQ